MNTTPCQYCQWPLLPEYIFCPHCGNRVAPLTISLSTQLGVYALSLLLPPLGIWPAIKYLRMKESIAKRVGIIALVLTAVSIIVTLWFSVGFISSISHLTSQIPTQLPSSSSQDQYQELGL